MSHPLTFRRTLSCFLFGALAVGTLQAGCGDTTGSEFSSSGENTSGSSGPIPPGFPGEGEGGASSSGNVDATGILDVTPATATINVTVANGVVSAPSQTFTASYNGQPVTGVTWLFDRGELGDISNGGVFTANGKNVGEGIVTARYGAREGSAKVKIVINATQNGAPAGVDAGGGGFGGIGGVGGEPLGAAVPADVVTKLKTESNLPANAQELGFLYPYDQTVWPRGLLPPLLMWQTTREASAVYVKLSQGNYTFEGTYLVSQHPAGSDARKRVRLEEQPWATATSGNGGDDLKLEVKIYTPADGGKVYGPITRTWKVAPGVLKGTVYYNSYDSFVTAGGGTETGGVIKIKPRSPDPELAVPSMAGKCHACHVVSADGSRLFVQDGKVTYPNGTDDYRNGASYDLTKANVPRTTYAGATTGALNRRFVWSAPYPDGSFALASYGYAREAYVQTESKLFSSASGAAEIAATNIGQVTSAVTPAFSPDGRKIAFNFWAGPGASGVQKGDGHSLAVFDFTCGAPAGSTKCAAGTTPAFSGLREIYKGDATRWPGWPSFLPDGNAVVFHNTVEAPDHGSGSDCRAATANPPPNINNCQLTTWRTGGTGARAEIWFAKDGATKDARRLDALNGFGPGGVSYLPTSGSHPNDATLNYMPTVNPVASGGYYWVVFTSRRLYGNLLTDDPYGGHTKKLWVAAVDINNPNPGDISHPAFYLPGQELEAGNSRGFWVVDPCKPNGQSCETGDECCNGFCRKDAQSGALVCQDKPPGGQCAQEFEKCTVDADCCDPKFECIAGKCTRPDPVIK